jgi:hypothetical protein
VIGVAPSGDGFRFVPNRGEVKCMSNSNHTMHLVVH